jgi:hypothetical protein
MTLPSLGNKMDKAGMAKVIADFLKQEGYMPNVDNDSILHFKIEGKTYLIVPNEGDDEYFCMIFPNFWPIESEAERTKAYLASAKATMDTKVAKVYPFGDNLVASVELFVKPFDSFKPLFTRSMNALKAVVDNFISNMRS